MYRFLYLLTFLAGAQTQEPKQPVFRAETGLVQVYARVMDKSGQPLNNIPMSAVHVFENGIEQEVKFVGQENVPVSLALAVDGDARAEELQPVTEALLNAFRSAEPARVARFDAEPDSGEPAGAPGRDDVKVLPLRPRTPMGDAVALLIRGGEPTSAEVKRALIIVADSASYRSWISPAPIIKAAEEKGISIYAVHLQHPEGEANSANGNGALRALRRAVAWTVDLFDDDVRAPSELQGELDQLTKPTGGETCSAKDPASAGDCAQRFAKEIRTQYVVAYRPQTLTRAERNVEIKVSGYPDAEVRVRRSHGTER